MKIQIIQKFGMMRWIRLMRFMQKSQKEEETCILCGGLTMFS